MTYCNQEIPDKNRRKRKQPSVLLCALDKERREAEIEQYRENPHMKMPVVFDVGTDGRVNWPKKFR